MEKFGEHEIIKLLKSFDALIDGELEIILCGGAAGILKHSFSRKTLDIDLVASIPKISQYEKHVKMVAKKYDVKDAWLNDGAKGYIDYVPTDFRERLEKFDHGFKRLKVFLLSDVDLYIMKLVAFRAEDILDIQSIRLEEKEMYIVKKTIRSISRFDQKTALKMKFYLKENGLWKK